jgi:enoyl-CoA hydratase/carnithine racemase
MPSHSVGRSLTDLVSFTVNNGIATLTMNDPETRNSMSSQMMNALAAARAEIDDRDDIRVLILTGAGEAFSAGGNMDDMTARKGIFASEDPLWARDVNVSQVHKIPYAIYGIAVPTIAAVNGYAIGGGCDLALMCDIRIASERAVFAESFLRVGLLPGDGGAWFMPRVVGLSRAMEMALTCDFIDAAAAERIGLVSRTVSHEKLLEEAHGTAARIARHPPQIARLTKRLLRFGAHASLEDTLEMTANMQGIAQTSEPHREAAQKLARAMKRSS